MSEQEEIRERRAAFVRLMCRPEARHLYAFILALDINGVDWRAAIEIEIAPRRNVEKGWEGSWMATMTIGKEEWTSITLAQNPGPDDFLPFTVHRVDDPACVWSICQDVRASQPGQEVSA